MTFLSHQAVLNKSIADLNVVKKRGVKLKSTAILVPRKMSTTRLSYLSITVQIRSILTLGPSTTISVPTEVKNEADSNKLVTTVGLG